MSSGVPARPARVVVNAVSAKGGGASTRLSELIPHLAADERLDLTVYAAPSMAESLAGRAPRATIVVKSPRALPLRLLWEQAVLPRRAGDADVIYCPGNLGLPGARVPVVVALQSHWHYGRSGRREIARAPRRFRARMMFEARLARASLRGAARLTCVSSALEAAVKEDLGPAAPTVVVASAPPEIPRVQPRRGAGTYALAVGTDLPHKDWDGLVEAFAGAEDLPRLVILGPVSEARQGALSERAPGRVEIRGPVDDRAELAAWLRGATCVVAHSRLESFGFVPLEALSCGVAVAASDLPAHREACGDAARYFDPEDPRALAEAVRAAIRDGGPAGEAPGLARSWHLVARDVADTLLSVAGR